MLSAVLIAGCELTGTADPPDELRAGTWGGERVGLIANDSTVHVHVNCTYGDFPAPVALDEHGRFTVDGSYLLRAYPVAIGPTMPAKFSGRVRDDDHLTFMVTVQDTVENKTVVLGPVTAVHGREPRMGLCPICRKPGERNSTAGSPAN